MSEGRLEIRAGTASECGKRESNNDIALVRESDDAPRTVVAVMADGISGAGGKLAAETAAPGFVEGLLSAPATLSAERAGVKALAAMNRWVWAQGGQDPALRGMATTLSAVILRGRRVFLVHIGDTRIYRLREGALLRLTHDHTHTHPDMQHVLIRAVGLEDAIRADTSTRDLKTHDRFLLCCDGVHGTLNDRQLRDLLADRASPEETAQRIVRAALDAGSQDNVTATVLDVLSIPGAERLDLEMLVAELPILDLPGTGDRVDGFHLLDMVSDGRYSRLFRANDSDGGREVIIKFPHPRVASDDTYRRAFVREAWVAAQVQSPYVGEVVDVPAERRTRLYSVMPYYAGETLERRLRREPPVSFEEGIRIGIQLGKALYALNRREIIHRDVKPENIMLTAGRGLRLLDLGVARLPGVEDTPGEDIPGTPSYMAPELFNGQAGDVRSDVYALGVTLYRTFTGQYPYGEVEAFTHPRFGKRVPLDRYRSDLPAWLDAVLARAVSVDPAERQGDAMELALELEHNLTHGPRQRPPRQALYARNPLRFWQAVSFLLLLALILSLALR